MKLVLSTVLIAILAFLVGIYTPWWSIALVAFGVAFLVPQTHLNAFLSGFLGIFGLWFIVAYVINSANNSILANRVGGLLGINNNAILLILITSFVGGLVGGLAALSASYLKPFRK